MGVVATLALGSQPKQRGYKVAGQEGGWECKECEEMNLHTPKWTPIMKVGIPNGLPNLQSAIARVKTHWFEKFFISLKSYWTINF